MNVLVTGATGFIGSNLVKRLLKRGWKVSVFVRNRKKLEEDIQKKCKVVESDLVKFKEVNKALRDIDVVFNLAAALPHHKLPELAYWNANVNGVRNIVEASIRNKVKRLVHVSTVGIYGRSFIYSKTKLEGEKIVQKYSRKGLKTVIVRPTIAYGPGDTRPGFLNLLKLIKKGIFIPIGNGENYFHTVYIDNLTDALLLVATHPKAIREDFIIGDNPVPKMKQIISIMQKVTKKKIFPYYIPVGIAFLAAKIFDIFQKIGLPSPLNTQRVRFLTENLKFDTSKARKILGYKPRISLEKGIGYTYSWYKKKGYL